MTRSFLALFFLILTSCGSNSINKPTLLLNAENYSNDAMLAYAEEDWVRAQRLFNRALSLNQSMDDRLGIVTSHINLVEVALALHDTQNAHRHLTLATDIVKTENLKNYQPRITLLYASLAIQKKQTALAIGFLHQLLPPFEENVLASTADAVQLAAIAIRTEISFEKMQNELLWTQRYGSAIKKSANHNNVLDARLLRFQSKLSLRKGAYSESIADLQQALILYKTNVSRSGIAATLLEMGIVYEQQSDWLNTLSYYKRSIAVFRSLGNDEKVTKVGKMLAKAELEIAKSNLDKKKSY